MSPKTVWADALHRQFPPGGITVVIKDGLIVARSGEKILGQLPRTSDWNEDEWLPAYADIFSRLGRNGLQFVTACAHATINGGEPAREGVRWLLAARAVEALPATAISSGGIRDWARFRVLSELFRSDSTGSETPAAYARATFGSLVELKERASAAREQWGDSIMLLQEDPSIADLDHEHEARLLVFRDGHRGEGLDLTRVSVPNGEVDVDQRGGAARQDVFVTWFAREFFTRRFAAWDLFALADERRFRRWLPTLTWFVAMAAFFIGWVWRWSGSDGFNDDRSRTLILVILGAASIATLAIVLGTLRSERFSYPFMLRSYAASVVGILATLGVPTRYLESVAQNPTSSMAAFGPIIAILVVTSIGYLTVEASLHGVQGRTAFGRACVVWLIGFAQASALATFSMFMLRPIFAEEGRDLSLTELWIPIPLVAVTASTLGVLLQVLWEDRPITYPLSALRTRRRVSH